MVLDEQWRLLRGVEPLSGPQGGPLSRTVKLILDPLVIRPVQNPECAGPIVTADGARALAARLRAGGDVLRATAAWFTLLKQARRAAGITEGNPQDLYFQRCFELATVSGMPDPAVGLAMAERALRDIHACSAGPTAAALKRHLGDAATAAALRARIDTAWAARPVDTVGVDHAPELAGLLDACAAARIGHDRPGGQAAFDELVAARAGSGDGIRLWTATAGHTAQSLGLTSHRLPQSPGLADTAAGGPGLPFDRTIYERLFSVLRAGERDELPAVADLVRAEITRSCAPWALAAERLRVTAAAGAALARGLHPIDAPRSADTLAQRVINRRWQREAYVLQARRLMINPDGAGAGPLATIAAELRTPWRSYLRRLWVRLHGRDVRGMSVEGTDELWDLLEGVARSVILDHRTRVKQALSVTVGADEADPAESRAG
jgi:hypothetical protein